MQIFVSSIKRDHNEANKWSRKQLFANSRRNSSPYHKKLRVRDERSEKETLLDSNLVFEIRKVVNVKK